MKNKINGLVDFHAHILPDVDHGCKNLDESLKLIERAGEIGISTIVATSHFYYHLNDIDDFLERRQRAYDMLVFALDKTNFADIKIVPAAEVALEPDMIDNIDPDKFRKLCISGTDYMLLEMPLVDSAWSNRVLNALYEIESKYGIVPIIAHIERYSDSHSRQLISRSYIAQVNADLFSTFSGRRKFFSLYNENAIHVIGSDIHDRIDRNYDNFEKLINKLPDAILDGMNRNALMLLNNETI